MAGSSDITAVLAARNDIVSFSTGAINVGDTGYAYLDVSTMDGSKVLFLVDNGLSTDATIEVIAGAEYSGGAVGNLTETLTASQEYIIGPLETANYKDSNGYIQFKKSTADTDKMYIRAILLP